MLLGTPEQEQASQGSLQASLGSIPLWQGITLAEATAHTPSPDVQGDREQVPGKTLKRASGDLGSRPESG